MKDVVDAIKQSLSVLIFWITVIAVSAITITIVRAHDFMLNGTRSSAGEWCCGAEDCGMLSPGALHATRGGYSVRGTVTYGATVTGNPADGPTVIEHVNEFWPYQEILPSPDGAAWRCKRPDGSPRCKFSGPPGS